MAGLALVSWVTLGTGENWVAVDG